VSSLKLGQENGRIEGQLGNSSPRLITTTLILGASSTSCTQTLESPFSRNGILQRLWFERFADYLTAARINCRWVCRRANSLFSERNRPLPELFNLLINPESHEFALRWHRDDIRETASEDEERRALATWHHGVSTTSPLRGICLKALQIQWNT
jgi:hypothetical protein